MAKRVKRKAHTRTRRDHVLVQLRRIVSRKQADTVRFQDRKSITVDLFTASMLVQLFNSFKSKKAKDKFLRMVDTKSGFIKLAKFGFERMK
jgi:hypothetical protein